MSTVPAEISIHAGGVELLAAIEPLWHELRQHHAALTDHFRDSLLAATFEARRAGLIAKSAGGLLVLLARRGDQVIGYCVSSIAEDATGEVDSLYVTEAERGHCIGHALMQQTLNWFQERQIHNLAVDVLSCNAAALQFYARYGFVPRTTRMFLAQSTTR